MHGHTPWNSTDDSATYIDPVFLSRGSLLRIITNIASFNLIFVAPKQCNKELKCKKSFLKDKAVPRDCLLPHGGNAAFRGAAYLPILQTSIAYFRY
jgi:hypothetical protein